jgi:ABC-type transporter Mla subunit MlaD
VVTNKANFILPAIVLLLLSIASYSQPGKLTVAFTKINTISKGVEVRVNGLPIGKVSDIRATKNLDTLFLILNITYKVRIPKGSQFYLDEGLIGSPIINIELSKEDTYLTSKDISIGTFRPFPKMTPDQIDSAKQQLKIRLTSPKVDSVKNK